MHALSNQSFTVAVPSPSSSTFPPLIQTVKKEPTLSPLPSFDTQPPSSVKKEQTESSLTHPHHSHSARPHQHLPPVTPRPFGMYTSPAPQRIASLGSLDLGDLDLPELSAYPLGQTKYSPGLDRRGSAASSRAATRSPAEPYPSSSGLSRTRSVGSGYTSSYASSSDGSAHERFMSSVPGIPIVKPEDDDAMLHLAVPSAVAPSLPRLQHLLPPPHMGNTLLPQAYPPSSSYPPSGELGTERKKHFTDT